VTLADLCPPVQLTSVNAGFSASAGIAMSCDYIQLGVDPAIGFSGRRKKLMASTGNAQGWHSPGN